MTPLGLHHQMYMGHHYGPGPWVNRGRADQTSVYYNKADSAGIGFNRTSSGSNAVEQYFPEVRNFYGNLATCPDNLLLWFHHLPWDYKMRSGRILWDELCIEYDKGVKSAQWLQNEWGGLKGSIDKERFEVVEGLLIKQVRDAKIWKDASILYFKTFSGKPVPAEIEQPVNSLEYYKAYRYTDIPGISR
jgi:alpha-glucuronidase